MVEGSSPSIWGVKGVELSWDLDHREVIGWKHTLTVLQVKSSAKENLNSKNYLAFNAILSLACYPPLLAHAV